jgi:hypothetical protein
MQTIFRAVTAVAGVCTFLSAAVPSPINRSRYGVAKWHSGGLERRLSFRKEHLIPAVWQAGGRTLRRRHRPGMITLPFSCAKSLLGKHFPG